VISFIIGKTCEDYSDLLDKLQRTPMPVTKLNDEAFTNWKVNHPEYKPRKVYNNGILELHHE
jgi:hypothetical protein